MCIIVYKPKDVKFPSIETLQNCYKNNNDGCGFMYLNKGKVTIQKGFRDFETFYKTVSKISTKLPVVMHFRISTQGGVKEGLTHPYPLCTDYESMRKLKNTCEVGIAHNGIIRLTSDYGLHDIDYNDTMTFIKEYASLIIDTPQFYKDGNKVNLLAKLAGSKLAIMSNDGNVELIGDFLEVDGCYYSNDTYKDYKSRYLNWDYTSDYPYYNDLDWTDEYWTASGYDFNYETGECPCAYSGYSYPYYCRNCKNNGKCTSILNASKKRKVTTTPTNKKG